MKKLFLMLLTTIILGSLVFYGCAEPTPTPAPPTPAPPTPAPPTPAPPTPAPPTPAPPTPAPPTPAPKVYNLTMGTFHPAEDPINRVINQAWFKWLEKNSNGQLKFTLLPGGQAAPPQELYDAARTNIVDIADCPFGQYADRFPLQEVSMLPMLWSFPGTRQISMTATALYDKYPEMKAEHTDVHVVCFHSSGPNHPGTIDKPLHTLEDWQGLLQIELGVWGAKTAQAFGATPVEMTPPEYPDAMAKGVVDGISSSFFAFNLFGHIQYINYITQASLYADPFVMVMNMNTWNSLPDNLKKLFDDSYWVLPELYGYDFDQTDQFMRGEIEKIFAERGNPPIYILPDDERAKWVEAALPVREEWVQNVAPEVGEAKARAILDDAVKFAEQYRYETTPVEKTLQTFKEWGAEGY